MNDFLLSAMFRLGAISLCAFAYAMYIPPSCNIAIKSLCSLRCRRSICSPIGFHRLRSSCLAYFCPNAMQGDEAEDSKILDAPSGRPQSSGNGAATAAPVAGSTKLKIRFGGSGKSSVHGQNGSLSTPITPIGEPNGAGGLAGEGAASMNVDLAAATAKKEQEAAQAAAEAEAQQAQLKQEAAAREAEEQREKLRAAEEQARQDQVYDAGLRELPQIARQHLVPLHEVVRRAIARSYSELQSLVEV